MRNNENHNWSPSPYNNPAVPYNALSTTAYDQLREGDDAQITALQEAINNLKKGLNTGTASRAIADMLQKVVDGKFNYQTAVVGALTLASLFVPEIGILTPFVGLFFSALNASGSHGSPTVNINNIFKAMQPAIEAMIDRALEGFEKDYMDTRASLLQRQFEVYQDAMYVYTAIHNPSPSDIQDLHTALDTTIARLETNLSDFTQAHYQTLGLPYYVLFATMLLMLISDKVKHGVEWGYNPQSIDNFQKQWNSELKKHTEYVTSQNMPGTAFDYIPNIMGFVSLWDTMSPSTYPIAADIDPSLTLFTMQSYVYPMGADGQIFAQNHLYSYIVPFFVSYDLTYDPSCVGTPYNYPLMTIIPANDSVVSVSRIGAIPGSGGPWSAGTIRYFLSSGRQIVDPPGSNPPTEIWLRVPANYTLKRKWSQASNAHDDVTAAPAARSASYLNFIMTTAKSRSNIVGKPDPDNKNVVPIKGIPAEKYSSNTGWQPKNDTCANNRQTEIVNVSSPMSSSNPGDILRFQINPVSTGQYKIRYRVATDIVQQELQFSGFGTTQSTRLPVTSSLSATRDTRGFLTYPSVKGIKGYYMLVDGPTVTISSAGAQEISITNTSAHNNGTIILDRIEFVPLNVTPTTPPGGLSLPFHGSIDTSPKVIWSGSATQIQDIRITPNPGENIYMVYLAKKGGPSGQTISSCGTRLHSDPCSVSQSGMIFDTLIAYVDGNMSSGVTSLNNVTISGRVIDARRYNEPFADPNQNSWGSSSNYTPSERMLNSPEDVAEVRNMVDQLFASPTPAYTTLAPGVTGDMINRLRWKLDQLSDISFGYDKQMLQELVNKAERLYRQGY
uniref:Crystaline entomocidal protoxin n=1 Tax=Bacillus thuringiensis TaxID=1428 RepID=A0A7G0YAD0_BACTU|nr:insecticidal crystal protein [Bacillus thuringiensis]